MATDIYICEGTLDTIDRGDGDVTGVPPLASLIAEATWVVMCREAGGEAKLVEALGLKDERKVQYA